MIVSLTTGWCAEFLNECCGMSAYSSAFILTAIRSGDLIAIEVKGKRRRAYVRIHPSDFRAYLLKHYPQNVAAFDRCFTLNNEIAS